MQTFEPHAYPLSARRCRMWEDLRTDLLLRLLKDAAQPRILALHGWKPICRCPGEFEPVSQGLIALILVLLCLCWGELRRKNASASWPYL